MIESDHNNITPQKQGAWDSRWREVLGIILKGGAFKPNEEWTRKLVTEVTPARFPALACIGSLQVRFRRGAKSTGYLA